MIHKGSQGFYKVMLYIESLMKCAELRPETSVRSYRLIYSTVAPLEGTEAPQVIWAVVLSCCC